MAEMGAYLGLKEECEFIAYNVRPPGGGMQGLQEIDVIGLKFTSETAYLCEVTTHIRGLLYVNNKTTIKRVTAKYQWQRCYAEQYLGSFATRHFMFWSPVVPRGYVTDNLAQIKGLQIVINEQYRECVDWLRDRARTEAQDTGNPFFRALQILEHLRD